MHRQTVFDQDEGLRNKKTILITFMNRPIKD